MDAAADILARAEGVRHGPAPTDEAPPPYPETFGPGFLPPPHSVKPLQTRFPSERGKRCVFFEQPHVYVVDDAFAYDSSVTTLVKKHCEEFDGVQCIERMRKSRREAWPRLKYAVDPLRIATVSEAPAPGLVLAVVAETGVTLCAEATDQGAEKAQAALDRKLARHFRGGVVEVVKEGRVHLYASPRAMTTDEILGLWDENRIEAANRGTWIHWQLELWSNSLPCHVDTELLNGLRFVGEVLAPMNVRCWATELEIFGEAEEIAGSVDWIGYCEDDPDALVIVDWKRSRHLTELVSAFGKRMSAPLHHMDDIDACKYALQLGCYAHLLEKYMGKKVRALALCCVLEGHVRHTFVPYLREEVAYLMRKRREEVAARLRVDLDDAENGAESSAAVPRCALTGRILTDGVRCEDGRLCNRRDAQVRLPGSALEDAVAETEAVRSRVQAVLDAQPTSPEEEALARCLPWTERMPLEGLAAPPPM